MSLSSPYSRVMLWLGALLSVIGLMSYGIYAERVLYLDPCPLCITQRMFYVGIGLFTFIGLCTMKIYALQRFCAALMALCAIGGIGTAGRQVWLQHLPKDQVPECGPGLQYWLENEPWLQTLSLLFKGDGNCAEVVWTFLGFSMGEWSLAWFVVLLLVALTLLFKRHQSA
ncbi:MAG: disulfide bond formation protein B [Granulosicoccus sp.]